MSKTTKNADYLLGYNKTPISRDFSEDIAWNDHKIKFCTKYAVGRDVLDIGCVQHNPENYRSRYWLHKALAGVANSIEGIDLYGPGVDYLNKIGYTIHIADAQDFDLSTKYDVIVAGDIIEHLSNVGNFLDSCRRHLRQNGKIVISTPNPWYWRCVVKAALYSRVNPNPEHSLWMCPDTLRQIALRYDYQVSNITFGSRYLRDRLLPLPKGLKHTSFHAVLEQMNSTTIDK